MLLQPEEGAQRRLRELLRRRKAAAQGAEGPSHTPDALRLIEDIRGCCRQMDQCAALFEMETDEDLLEASIYQMKALKSRYRYLLRLARERRVETSALPVWEEEEERWVN
ncbi:MAG: YaaL family protein [Oscillospiraceae bacterium]|jgi:hypothetical protein|nr:YaaL family protein [Oscillospiraceae bacterium]